MTFDTELRRYEHEAVAQLLVDKKANITARSKDRHTAPTLAAEYGHEAVVRLPSKQEGRHCSKG
jgi:ankyrin repeat protein